MCVTKTICHTVVVYSELDIVLAEIECRIGVAVADCGVFHRHCRLDYAVDNLIFEFLYFGSYAKIVIFESHGYCGVDRVPRRRKHREAKRIGGDDINGYTSAGRRHFIGFGAAAIDRQLTASIIAPTLSRLTDAGEIFLRCTNIENVNDIGFIKGLSGAN